MLDSRTLLSAAVVCKKWLNLCHEDSTLQKRILKQILKERRECLDPVMFIVERKCPHNYQALSTMNGYHRVTVSSAPSKYSPICSFLKIKMFHNTGPYNYVIATFKSAKKIMKCIIYNSFT